MDTMDWPRFLRALDAAALEAAERKRAAYMAGEVSELAPSDWKTIAEHDKLYTEWLAQR